LSSLVVQKHSRLPRKQTEQPKPPAVKKDYSVAKRPLGNIPAERRAEIADQVLSRYMLGEQVANIAPEYGTSDVTIYALLLREHEQAWVDIQQARALARFERCQDELSESKKEVEVAQDALSLARAREKARIAESQLKSAQWELERLLKRLYGQDQNITVNINSDLGDRLRRARERVIDAEVVPTPRQDSNTDNSDHNI